MTVRVKPAAPPVQLAQQVRKASDPAAPPSETPYRKWLSEDVAYIILDAERSAINASINPRHLDLLGDAPARNSARFHRLLQRASHARWTLSYADLELRDRRARVPSNDLLDAFRGATGYTNAKDETRVRTEAGR